MIRQYIYIARMLMDSRITRTPRRVLKELGQRGKRRLPSDVEKSLSGALPGLKGLAFVRRWLDGEQITRHNGQWVLNSFLPPMPSAAFDRMFENLLSGRRLSPVSAFLAVSGECSYRCWHCSVENRAQGNLPTAQWLKGIEGLQRLGVSLIGFTGGEPSARTDLVELVGKAVEGGATTIVFSSGAGMTKDLLCQLKEAGLWSICISLDHPTSKEHDRLRRAPGAFDTACDVLREASQMGFYTMTGTVATRALVEQELLTPMHKLAADMGVHEFRIVEPMPCGELAENKQGALLEPKHLQAIRRFHVETNRKGHRPKVCAFNQIESPELFGCGAGTQHLYVDSRGEVCPCDFTAMSFGNITAQPMETIWERMTAAMGNPRRHCFIQKHHDLLLKHGGGHFPLSPEQSEAACHEAGQEDLPDYFQQIMGIKK